MTGVVDVRVTRSWSPARPLIAALRGYQRWISPALPPTCRFHPTCSTYAIEALQVHGVVRGVALAAWRLLRCAPWHPGGVDPVPPRRGPSTPTGAGPGAAPGGEPDISSPEGSRVDHRNRSAENREEQAPC